jgi:DNA-binding response OmpR family regulator
MVKVSIALYFLGYCEKKKTSCWLIWMDGWMDGCEVCRQLKLCKATAHVPVIFVTAMSEMEDECKGFELWGVDHIIKPISPETVLAKVKIFMRELLSRAKNKI